MTQPVHGGGGPKASQADSEGYTVKGSSKTPHTTAAPRLALNIALESQAAQNKHQRKEQG